MGKLKKLTTEDILTSMDVKPEELEVPAWGGSVTIQPFTKAAQQRARKAAIGEDGEIDSEKLEMILFIEGVVEPKFTIKHFDALREKSAGAIDLVLTRVMAVSGITDDESKEAGAFFRTES